MELKLEPYRDPCKITVTSGVSFHHLNSCFKDKNHSSLQQFKKSQIKYNFTITCSCYEKYWHLENKKKGIIVRVPSLPLQLLDQMSS